MKKHIVCFGDSNTHGYCADPKDCADGGDRFNEDERWTCLLQKALGEDCLVIEEGLSGRTTVFDDPLHECMSGLDVIYSTLMSHEPVDLLIIMPHIGDGLYLRPEGDAMGLGCPEKSRELAKYLRPMAEAQHCAFLDAEGVAEFNRLDCMHLTGKGHRQLAEKLAGLVPTLLS